MLCEQGLAKTGLATSEASAARGTTVLAPTPIPRAEGMGGRAGGARKGPSPSQHSRIVVHTQSPRSGTTCAAVDACNYISASALRVAQCTCDVRLAEAMLMCKGSSCHPTQTCSKTICMDMQAALLAKGSP